MVLARSSEGAAASPSTQRLSTEVAIGTRQRVLHDGIRCGKGAGHDVRVDNDFARAGEEPIELNCGIGFHRGREHSLIDAVETAELGERYARAWETAVYPGME